MNNEKIENLLNLALDATEREREKSLELDVGYNRQERTWEVIVKYTGTAERLKELLAENFAEDYERIQITDLQNEYCRSSFAGNDCTGGRGARGDRVYGEAKKPVFCSCSGASCVVYHAAADGGSKRAGKRTGGRRRAKNR